MAAVCLLPGATKFLGCGSDEFDTGGGGGDVDDDDDVHGVLSGKAREEEEKEKDNIDGDHLGLFIN